LGELNDRFAGYVERVRFLEAQNKKLQIELDVLKSKWGSETKQIEQMYKVELEEARSVLNDTSKNKDFFQLQLVKQESELETMRRR
jgi:intermediate filament protein if